MWTIQKIVGMVCVRLYEPCLTMKLTQINWPIKQKFSGVIFEEHPKTISNHITFDTREILETKILAAARSVTCEVARIHKIIPIMRWCTYGATCCFHHLKQYIDRYLIDMPSKYVVQKWYRALSRCKITLTLSSSWYTSQLIPSNIEHKLRSMNIRLRRWWTWLARLYPCLLALGIIVLNPFLVGSDNWMQKTLPVLALEQLFTDEKLPFRVSRLQLMWRFPKFPTSWTIPVSLERRETTDCEISVVLFSSCCIFY